MNPQIESLVARVAAELTARGEWLALAESCTGGGVAQSLTGIPGSSAWFDRGFVTYSNIAKMEMLGVLGNTLERHGAVSEATARAMAQGALVHSRSQWTVAITGIAGPGGGTPDKPVGTVCFAWANKSGACVARTCRFAGDRAAVREQAIHQALAGLLEQFAGATLLA